MKVLVITHKHHLLPFAWRLHNHHHVPVEVIVKNKRFEKAWGGRLPKLELPQVGEKELYAAVREIVVEQGMVVVTDSDRWSQELGGIPNLFPTLPFGKEPISPLYVGGWFDGERFISRHLYIEEWGLWPGGMGPSMPAVGTCIFNERNWPVGLEVALNYKKDELKGLSFRGLVLVALGIGGATGSIEPLRMKAGWHLPHAHTFLSDLEDMPGLLMGLEQFPHKSIVMSALVTVPPYPFSSGRAEEPRGILIESKELTKRMFFHDLQLNGEEITTAGLDGLVAIVRGSGRSFQVARGELLRVANAIQVREKQFRTDAGLQTEQVYSYLQELGLGV